MKTDPPNYLFGNTTTFEKKFPVVADISISITEIISGLFKEEYSSGYSGINEVPPRHPCSNQKCKDGGVDLNEIIGQMVSNRETTYEKRRLCHGRNTSPKGRKDYGGCSHDFLVKINIVYKE